MIRKVGKVRLFWEGHKNVHNRTYGFEIYLVNVKTMRTIAQIFVAFSEKLDFNTPQIRAYKNMNNMAIPIVEFSREGYKIRKVFG